jgi:membrane protein implicated in regulation of membrane protease activity
MLSSNRVKAVLNVLLGVLFLLISVGAAAGEGYQKWPLALTFGVFAAYSFVKAVGLLRRQRERASEESR